MYWALNYENSKCPARVNHASVSVGSYIYLFGGYCENRKGGDVAELREPSPIDCFEFNTITHKWNKRPAPAKDSPQYEQTPYYRYGHTCVNYKNSVILWGGRADWNTFQGCNTIFSYDPRKHLWSKVEVTNAAPKGRDGHTACVINDSMLVFGGLVLDLQTAFSNDLYEFCFLTRSWTRIDTPVETRPSCREFHTASVVGECMYVFGGRKDVAESRFTGDSVYLNDMYVFDTNSRQWNKIVYKQADNGQIETSTAAATASALATERQLAPCERRSHSAVVIGKKLLIFGGVHENIKKHFSDMNEFDTETNEWRRVRPAGMRPQARRRHSCHVVADKLYVFSGSGPILMLNNHGAEPPAICIDNLSLIDLSSPPKCYQQPYGHLNNGFANNTNKYQNDLNLNNSNQDSWNPISIFLSRSPMRHPFRIDNNFQASMMNVVNTKSKSEEENEYSLFKRNVNDHEDSADEEDHTPKKVNPPVHTLSDLHILQLKVPTLKFLALVAAIDWDLDYSELPSELIKNLDDLSASKINRVTKSRMMLKMSRITSFDS